MTLLRRLVKETANAFGLEIRRRNAIPILENVFQSSHSKRALVSYLKLAFEEPLGSIHSNRNECHSACRVLDSLGYRVDVCDFDERESLHHRLGKYEIVFGFGEALEQSFYVDGAEQIKRIYYGTTHAPNHLDSRSALRVKELFERTGKLMPSAARLSQKSWRLQTLLCDAYVLLGNDVVKNTYLEDDVDLNCYSLDGFFFDTCDIDVGKKDFESAQKHFLWMGSSGALHKGLDLLLDVFVRRKDLTLHLAGLGDTRFREVFREELSSSNIVDHGWVDLKLEQFHRLMETCGAVILPSASEAMAGAILNPVANGGLIPIVGKNTGMGIEECSVLIDELTPRGVERAVDKYLKIPAATLRAQSRKAWSEVRKRFTYDRYFKGLKDAVSDALSSTKSSAAPRRRRA